MRKVFFGMFVLFTMQLQLSAQRFVLMKESKGWTNFGQIMSKDSCVYRVEGYNQLIIENMKIKY